MFKCKEGCNLCCGPVTFSHEIIKKHGAKSQGHIKDTFELDNGILYWTEDNYCVFNDRETKKCLIYEDRPQICREFGTTQHPDSPLLLCPHFKPNGNPWSEAKSKQIQKAVNEAMKRTFKHMEENAYGRRYTKTDTETGIRRIGSNPKITTRIRR